MKKITIISSIVCLLFIANSCKKDKEVTPTANTINTNIEGYAQKGPYNTGTNITLIELSETMQQTGLNFHATVSDKYGHFSIPNVVLNSNYVELMADGYFFDERTGYTTEEKLVLRAVANVNDASDININMLTHISANRIKHLIEVENLSFSEAKNQTQNELLNIFSLTDSLNQDYTQLDISGQSTLNSKLVAISSIILGSPMLPESYSVSSLTEFLTEIALDFEDDGQITSSEIQQKLATRAEICNVGKIRKNLSSFYQDDSAFIDFHNHINTFRENTSFEALYRLNFLASNSSGENLLAFNDTKVLETSKEYSIVPENDDIETIFIAIHKISGDGEINHSVPDSVYNHEGWYYAKNFTDETYTNHLGIIGASTDNLENASETPFTLNLTGSGELLLHISVKFKQMDEFDFCYIEKYMKW